MKWSKVLGLIDIGFPTWPRSKKFTEKTWTSSLEDFKKETIRGIQLNLLIYVQIDY